MIERYKIHIPKMSLILFLLEWTDMDVPQKMNEVVNEHFKGNKEMKNVDLNFNILSQKKEVENDHIMLTLNILDTQCFELINRYDDRTKSAAFRGIFESAMSAKKHDKLVRGGCFEPDITVNDRPLTFEELLEKAAAGETVKVTQTQILDAANQKSRTDKFVRKVFGELNNYGLVFSHINGDIISEEEFKTLDRVMEICIVKAKDSILPTKADMTVQSDGIEDDDAPAEIDDPVSDGFTK